MVAGFRSNVFDPVLIISKIITLQCFFYVTLGVWILLADSIAGIRPSLDQIFHFRVGTIYWLYYCVFMVCVFRSLKVLMMDG